MYHYVKLETCPFRGPLFVKKKASIEQILQSNLIKGSRPKDFNKNTDTSSLDPPKAKISCHWPKIKAVWFEDPQDQINSMENRNYATHLIDAHEEHIK